LQGFEIFRNPWLHNLFPIGKDKAVGLNEPAASLGTVLAAIK